MTFFPNFAFILRSPGYVNAAMMRKITFDNLFGFTAVGFKHPDSPIGRRFSAHHYNVIAIRGIGCRTDTPTFRADARGSASQPQKDILLG
jgi:hypothetical protein